MGTPSYMAPEQAAGKTKEIGRTTDVYGLGAILYECLTGRPPFRAASTFETVRLVQDRGAGCGAPRLNPGVPRDLETICLKCLAKEPQRRYPSAQELAEDLKRFRGGQPIHARPAGRVERNWRWCRRNPAVASLLGTVAATLLIGATVASFFAVRAEQRAEEVRQEANEKETQRREAEKQRAEAEKHRQEAEKQKAEAETQRKTALEKSKQAEAEKLLAQEKEQRARLMLMTTQLLRVEAVYRSDPAKGWGVTARPGNLSDVPARLHLGNVQPLVPARALHSQGTDGVCHLRLLQFRRQDPG